MLINHPLHLELKTLFKDYFHKESVIIERLQQVSEQKLYRNFGYPSLFQYCVSEFGVSDSRAYLLVGVSRKCAEVPQLKEAIDSGRLTASTAKRILPVIQKDNSDMWIQKAMDLSQRELEREVAKTCPESTIHERIKAVSENSLEFTCRISPELETKLLRARDIACQRLQKIATWDQALSYIADEYLDRRDPVRRAERILGKRQSANAVASIQ